MNLSYILFFPLVVLLLLGLVLALKRPRKKVSPPVDPKSLEVPGQLHATHLPQIGHALGSEDFEFLARKASPVVARRVRHERRTVALAYLDALRNDFESLLETAKVIAAFSPAVAAGQEFETARLTARFFWRYQTIRWKLLAGSMPLPQLHSLSDLVSSLSVRIEAAIKELGERAAAAADLTSTVNRGGLNSI